MSQTRNNPGRNAPCPCGSGKKYKQCCLEKDEAALRETRAKAAEETAKETSASKPEPETPKETGSPQGGGTAPHQPPKRPSKQPWKRATGNAHPTQRKSMPRKFGDG